MTLSSVGTAGLSCEVQSKVLSLAAAHSVILLALHDEVVAWLDALTDDTFTFEVDLNLTDWFWCSCVRYQT